jgi:hypothetical protein
MVTNTLFTFISMEMMLLVLNLRKAWLRLFKTIRKIKMIWWKGNNFRGKTIPACQCEKNTGAWQFVFVSLFIKIWNGEMIVYDFQKLGLKIEVYLPVPVTPYKILFLCEIRRLDMSWIYPPIKVLRVLDKLFD